MSLKWENLKNLYKKDHLSKGLKKPGIRLNALENIDRLMKAAFPEVIASPEKLNQITKARLSNKLEDEKGYALNSAEKSVITGLYKFLPQMTGALVPISVAAPANRKREELPAFSSKPKTNDKLWFYQQIGEIAKKVTGLDLNIQYSATIIDLSATPLAHVFPKTWHLLSDVYRQINDHGLVLDEVVDKEFDNLKKGRQEADLLILSPIQCIIEYDEEQHFNPFRLETLKSPLYKNWDGFDVASYKRFCDVPAKKGSKKSGFYYLKSADPLFPEMPGEEKQDNRLRQRAFRDMIKDAWSIEKGWKHTIRIPCHIAGKKRKNLNSTDLTQIESYLNEKAGLK